MMEEIRKYIFIYLFVFSSLNLENEAKSDFLISQTQILIFKWKGQKVECNDTCSNYPNTIESDGSYACSNNSEYWLNGKQSFLDPVPLSTSDYYLITGVKLMVVGRFNCQNSSTINVNFTLQDQIINIENSSMPTLPNNCNCLYCMNFLEFNAESENGWPGYNYGKNNTISIQSDNTICIDYLNLTLFFYKVNPQVMAIFPDSGPNSGNTSVTIFSGDPGFIEGVKYMCNFGFGEFLNATFVNQQEIVCISPRGEGDQEILIEISSIDYIVHTGVSFKYYLDPVLISITPPSGQAEDIAIIEGSNFSNVHASRIKWGYQIITPNFISSNYLNVTVPSENGTVMVSLSQNGQQYTNSIPFVYIDIPPSNPPNFPGWILVVVIFGGLTIVAIIILIISKKYFTSNDESNETTSLLNPVSDSMFMKQIDISSVKILQRIGKGTFGEVFKGVWNATEVAIKFLNSPSVINDQFLQDFYKEVMIMRGCRHPNVLQFLGASTKPPNICIVMEYMPLGSLYKIIHDDSVKLELVMIRKMMIDAAKGMNYLHKSNPVIIHRDLKSHNLLVDENWKVKVCDFGLSRIIDTTDNNNMTACGTPSWTAPEILRNEQYYEKADVYSFGIVLWECITRQDPYEGMAPFQVVLNVGTKLMRPIIPESCPTAWVNLVTSCWSEVPSSRPSFDEIILLLEAMSPRR